MSLRITAALSLLILHGCGESGNDQEGPYKAYLLLKDTSGISHDFYLGGHNRLENCIEMIEFEVSTYERDYNRKFYTNAEIDYGGHKSDKLFVEHLIVGAQCIEEN